VIGTVVSVDGRTGVVIAARPVAAPSRVRVLWQPVEHLLVTEHPWPPTTASIVGMAETKIAGRTRRAPATPQEEPIGFAQWLGFHHHEGERHGLDIGVPRAGTTHRATMAAAFAALVAEGYGREDFEAASVGVLADSFMRENRHIHPENVLRKTKIGRRIADGRAELARRASEPAGTDWGRFDG
jgi:hypothetical protein